MTPCPSCGNKRAYVGFTTVECPSPKCQHYNASVSADPEPDDSGEYTWLENAYADYMKMLMTS
jgi:uncharacterized protein (DUF983 family)